LLETFLQQDSKMFMFLTRFKNVYCYTL